MLPPHWAVNQASPRQPWIQVNTWPGQYIPNFGDWRPGDIVLVQSAGDLASQLIVASQGRSGNPYQIQGQAFTHAAIYAGPGNAGADRIIEAVPGLGVVETSIWPYCQSRRVLARRVPGMTTQEESAIVQMARSWVGRRYSFTAALSSALMPTWPHPNYLYCSSFVGLVIAGATSIQLYDQRLFRPLLPSTLAVHPYLDNVKPLEWCDL